MQKITHIERTIMKLQGFKLSRGVWVCTQGALKIRLDLAKNLDTISEHTGSFRFQNHFQILSIKITKYTLDTHYVVMIVENMKF